MAGKASVLLIDDVGFIRKQIVSGLQGHSYDVDGFESLSDAQKSVESKTYDAILLDYFLKDVKGTEVLDRLREFQKETPVLIISAKPDKDMVLELSKYKIAGIVAKPINVTELAMRLDALLENKPAAS